MVVGCDLVQQAIVERSYSVVHLVLWLRHPTMIGVTPKKTSVPVCAADSGKRVESIHLRLHLQHQPPVAAPGCGPLVPIGRPTLRIPVNKLPQAANRVLVSGFRHIDLEKADPLYSYIIISFHITNKKP